MNRRFLSVLLFALVVSSSASLLVYHFVLTNVLAAGIKPVPTRRLLVASHNLEVGSLIREMDLRWIQSSDAIPEGVINDSQQVIGRGVIAAIYEGEPIASARLAQKGAGAGLAAMIPLGKRAVALKVDQVVGLAGFVVPGMRVDVIIAGNPNSNATANGDLSRTVLQNIEVLSAGQKIEKRADGKPEEAQVVNLLVTPDQAEILSLASNETKVQLVLRNPLDTKEEATHGTSLAALFGLSAPAPPPRPVRVSAPKPVPAAAAPEPATVEVFSGTKRTEQKLDVR
jgi:pilus assembly protein CpaB